jgi:membrane protease YdiL (CAAX protease family)
MKHKNNYKTSQLFNFAQDSYLERTSRPIYALVFLLPFIIFYELGTLFINTNLLRQYWQGRVVAFSWMQRFLEYVGFGSKLAWVATPLTVVVILIGLQLASRKNWRFWWGDIGPMLIECILLAIPLIVLGLVLNSSAPPNDDPGRFSAKPAAVQLAEMPGCAHIASENTNVDGQPGDGHTATTDLLADIVTAIGAGIYEELIFRLILICLLMLLFQDVLGLSHNNSIILSVLVSAALFSAYHHVDLFSGQIYQVQTDPFNWTKFGFRTMAGVYFAVVFAIRGFGITAGTHAFYDVIATILNAVFFSSGN